MIFTADSVSSEPIKYLTLYTISVSQAMLGVKTLRDGMESIRCCCWVGVVVVFWGWGRGRGGGVERSRADRCHLELS